ncbi:hypothetical protein AB6G29_17785 [Providencia hangzhouensis]|uniref:hypothetical protein n=1 Tax=Providencia hangzhouensis TaxID=3031799 RepID=UPI0034DCE19A
MIDGEIYVGIQCWKFFKPKYDLYAELSFNDVQWGEISLSEDKKEVKIIIYPDSDFLEFNYSEFLLLIEKS